MTSTLDKQFYFYYGLIDVGLTAPLQLKSGMLKKRVLSTFGGTKFKF